MKFDLRFYWAMFLRRLPVMLLLLLICAGFGIVSALKLPDTYQTSARLLVEAPQIPDRMVSSTVQTGADEQLEIIEQKLLTRANLIDIAHKHKVFANINAMDPDTVVRKMRQATRIKRSSGRERATLMIISFEARAPQIAANVVNEYVTLVLEENAEFRMSRTENTLQFFQQEVERLGADLNRQSAAIATFKSDNADALPEDQSYRLGRQNLLQERLSRLERDLKAATDQREEMIRVFQATGQVGASPERRGRTPEEQRLRAAQLELEKALAVYSETSPKVVRLQSVVDRLATVVANRNAGSTDGTARPEEALLQTALAEVDSRIESMQGEIASTRTDLEDLQQSIAQSAANGIQLATLERDYRIIQGRYNAAVENLNQAQMSERVETASQGQRITVVENANVPRSPSGPDRPKIAIMGALAGAGLAAAYFLLLELLNRNIRRPSELTGAFDVIPISTIPYMESQRERLLRRTGLVTATLLVLIGVPIGLWYVDTHYVPLEQIVQTSLSKLGLG